VYWLPVSWPIKLISWSSNTRWFLTRVLLHHSLNWTITFTSKKPQFQWIESGHSHLRDLGWWQVCVQVQFSMQKHIKMKDAIPKRTGSSAVETVQSLTNTWRLKFRFRNLYVWYFADGAEKKCICSANIFGLSFAADADPLGNWKE